MSVVGRSPFEYLLNAPAGGGFATAFQEGEAAASRQASEASMRAEAAQRQRLVGLQIGEFQAGAPLREAERRQKLGKFEYGDQLAREGIAVGPAAAPGVGAQLPGTAGFIANFERFRADPYEDMTIRGGQRVSAGLRAGYGSDTVTLADGSVVRIAPGMTVSEADAQRDLYRRIETEFQPRAVKAVGPEVWSSLPPQAHDALVSIAYNYGNIPTRLATAAKTGNPEQIASAIEALAGDNGGINRQRRLAEAAHVRSALAVQPAAPQAPARPPVSLPAGALGEGFLRSPAGVPYTIPEGDLPAAGASETQGGGAPGMPAPAFTRLPGTAPLAGPVAPSQPFSSWLAEQAAASQGAYQTAVTPGAAPAATTPTRAADQLLGGATGIVPAGLSPAMGGGTPLAGAISPVPLAGQRQGLLPTPVQGVAAAAARQQQQQAQPVGLGLEYSEPAQRLAQRIAQEKALLEREFASIGLLPPGEAQRTEAARIRRAYTALVDQEADVRADLAAGGVLTGQAGMANQLLARNGILAQPKVTNGRFTGYDLIRNGSVVQSNVSPEKLADIVRNSYNASARRQMQERAQAQYDAMLEAFKDRAKQLGIAQTEIAKIEATARTRGFSQVSPMQADGSILLTNPATGDSIRYAVVPVPGGKKGETRLEVTQGRANVPVQ